MLQQIKPTREKVLKNAAIIYAVILIVATAPILAALGAGWVTSLFGVELNEGGAPDIQFHGVHLAWLGDVLYTLGNLVWLAIVTIPLGVVALIGYTLHIAILLLRSRSKIE